MSFRWCKYSLDQICEKITDGSHQSPKSYKGNNGKLMFSVKDMTEHGFDINSAKIISETDYLRLAKQGCKPKIDDVLIAKDGSVMKHVFKVNIVLMQYFCLL